MDKILIVDDDAGVRDSMQEYIMDSGYDIYTASSAEEALELLKSDIVDVVITDIMLTGMDGLELTDLIKHNYDIDVIANNNRSVHSALQIIDDQSVDILKVLPVSHAKQGHALID